jgi:hypothetical protein
VVALGPPPSELTVEIGALDVGLDRLTGRTANPAAGPSGVGSRPHGDGESTRFSAWCSTVRDVVIPMVIQTIQLALPEPKGTDDTLHLTSLTPLDPTSQTLSTRLRIWRLGVRVPRGAPQAPGQLACVSEPGSS